MRPAPTRLCLVPGTTPTRQRSMSQPTAARVRWLRRRGVGEVDAVKIYRYLQRSLLKVGVFPEEIAEAAD